MATLLKVLNNLADIKSAGGVALRVRTQVLPMPLKEMYGTDNRRLRRAPKIRLLVQHIEAGIK
jgi:hypothetical protein